MDLYQIILIVAIAVCVVLSAFFSSAETAFSCINKIRVKHAAKKGNKAAKRVLYITKKYDKMLSTILIGNNIVNIACASIGTILFTLHFEAAGAGISTLVITIVVLFFGEVIPKSVAKGNPESIACAFSLIINALMVIFTPLSATLVFMANLSSKIFKGKSEEPSVTEQELKYIVEEIENEGVLEEQESELVRSALDFDEITVDQVLTPRVDLVSIDVNDSIEDIKTTFLTERFSRIPVYEESIDKIIGIMYEKDFFKHYIVNPNTVDVRSIIHPPIFALPQKKISDLLKELQSKKYHIAVVSDQYGGTLGIVTMEDILEQLVGEIWDEDDDIIEDIVQLGENTYSVKADMILGDLFEELELEPLETEHINGSVGNWVLETLEKIPAKNDSFTFENYEITVSHIEDKRIITILFKVNEIEEKHDDNDKIQ